MLNVSENLKNILRNDRFPLSDTITPKDLEITFDGMDSIHADQMVDDSFSLTESIISDNDIRFGTCRASQIKFKLANVPEDLKGKEFTIDQLIGATDIIPLGKYKVDSAKLQDDLIFKEVIAYDKLRGLDVDVSDWYNGLFPTGEETYTLGQFRSSLLTYLGIDEVSQTLANDDMEVTKTIEPTQISGRVVLEATVELNGAFGHIDRQGNFTRIALEPAYGLYPSETLYPSEDLYPVAADDTTPTQDVADTVDKAMYQKVRFEEYTVKEIDKLIIRSEEDDVGAIVGTGSNAYIIEGNFLVFGKSAEDLEQIAINVFGNVAKRPYRPYTAQSIGLSYVEVGDALQFATDDTVVGYVLQRTLTGIQVLKDEYEAPGSEEREQNFGVNKEITQLQGRYARIKKDVGGIVQTVGDLEQNVSTEISQLADQIVLKVDANGNIGIFKLSSEEDGTQVLIKADNIELEGLITANGNFKVLEDGSIEAVNGKFKGEIEAETGSIAGFDFTDDSTIGGLYYNDNGKFFRISPLSSFSGDGEGGSNPDFASIDLGTVDLDGGINTNIHLRNDGYARFGLVREGGYSLRINDYLRGEEGTDTILYSQNFWIGTDGVPHIKNSPDVQKGASNIDITYDIDGRITNLLVTNTDDTTADIDIVRDAQGRYVSIGDTIITHGGA